MVERSGPVPEEELNLTYDYENRLVEGSVPERGLTLNYSYDPFGKRLSKTVNGSTKYYLYDNEDIIVEYDSTGSLIASYIHGQGIDEPIQGLSPQGTVPEWYYTFDGLGSVSELTDESEGVVESYKYDSFGNPTIYDSTSNPKAQSCIGNPYMFTSREYDGESELYYYRFRYYDPAIGRFITEDPLQFFGGFNAYLYCVNNPINFIDPAGLKQVLVKTVIIATFIFWYSDYLWGDKHNDPSGPERMPDFYDIPNPLTIRFLREVPDCYIRLRENPPVKKNKFDWGLLFMIMTVTETITYEWGPDPNDPCCK